MDEALKSELRAAGFEHVKESKVTGRLLADYGEYDLFLSGQTDGTFLVRSNHRQLDYTTKSTSADPAGVAREIKNYITAHEVMES